MTAAESDATSYFLFSSGVVVLYLAAVRPKWLHFLPGNNWFNGAYPASRLGSIVGGITCLIAAAWREDLIPNWAMGLVVAIWGSVIVCAAVFDLPSPRGKD